MGLRGVSLPGNDLGSVLSGPSIEELSSAKLGNGVRSAEVREILASLAMEGSCASKCLLSVHRRV